jgi:peptidoglycan/xylan/chitin deacetylase (PgdA/CDA1 family)
VSDRLVALTFDAEHPSRSNHRPDGPMRLLDALAEAGVRATFFVQGRWATAHPETAVRIVADGHLVGNHSNYHAPMTLLTRAGFEADVREATDRIMAVTGTDPRPWFRLPFGDGADRSEILAGLLALGYRSVHWDVDSRDWEDGASARDVEEATIGGLRIRGERSIALMHTWPAATAESLPGIVEGLRQAGASFVTVEELADAR